MFATNLRTALSPILHGFALGSGLSPRLARRLPVGRIMMLHGIGDADLPARDLIRNLNWLKRNFQICSLNALIDCLDRGTPIKHAVALTFDDGLCNHFDVAYPILRELGVPATFFVCPDLMDRNAWLWNHEARARLRTMSDSVLAEFAKLCGAPRTEPEDIVTWMKDLKLPERRRIETELRQATPYFAPSAADHQRFDPISIEQLRQMDDRLVTVGSHTMSHPILPSLDDKTLDIELAESRAWLERRLDRSVDLFCYPNGANDSRVRAAVGRIYRAAVTTEPGFINAGVRDLLGLPRIAMTASTATLAWRLWR